MKEITLTDLERFEEYSSSLPNRKIIADSVINNGILAASRNYEKERELTKNYSLELDAGDVTNQKQSGRCWMFAATNLMRLKVMKNLNLGNMELSQNYPLFYDKLEKSNYFLENIIATREEKTSSRVVSYLLTAPLGDGGQFDMFASLVKKYGVVPKICMPETATSSKTMLMNNFLTKKLREYAYILREEHKDDDITSLRNLKDNMLKEIYHILVLCLGKPPLKFTFETRDLKNNFIRIENITPQEFFAKYVAMNLDSYISIINAPTDDKPYNRSFTVKFLGNIYPDTVKYLNLPIERLKELLIAQLKDGEPVWFGSDVGQFSDREKGYLSVDALDVKSLFNTEFKLDKKARLDYGESLMTHAMVFTGVNLVDGKPNRYKVENSWGKEPGYDGFFAMDDEWFNEYVYQIVIDKKYLTKEELDAYNSDPIVLEPWDPMGSLA